jgi:hypothetical protein
MLPLRLATCAALTDADALAPVLGPVASVERAPLATVGFSGARHERLAVALADGGRRALVLKRVPVADDWVARRSADDLGREAALLAEPALAAVWDAVACPYLAFAAEGGEIALLMDDLSPFLLPDVREPIAAEHEERLLRALATLHARFWASPVLDALPWLARAEHYAGLVDARCGLDPDAIARIPEALGARIARGWAAALGRLPRGAAELLTAPAADVAAAWAGLPRTLLHGDSKVANFAFLPGGRVAAFDWALMGAAPAAVEVGWYLGVNATRLAQPKDAVLARYRALLTERLPGGVPDATWEALVRVAVVAGARMLLWAKAFAVEADAPGARAEWAWWAGRLEEAASA